jgi:citryl-CoA synthetase large subunit
VRLYEKEAKELLGEHGVETPPGDSGEVVVKAQVLTENRKEKGGIKFVEASEAEEAAREMRENGVNDRNDFEVLVESQVDIEEEYYVSFIYDTDTRTPVLLFSKEGGSGIEDRSVEKLELEEPSVWRFRQFLEEEGIESGDLNSLASTLNNCYNCFLEKDCRILEINPLAKTPEGFVAVDALAELEDDASYRHDWSYPDRSEFARAKTEREKTAEKIDENDHRGVAGKYIEMDGDIGMMTAGGGASLTNMDALIEAGGEPANYTEYGGNPPEEKVYRLTHVIAGKPGLKGLWHVGGTANNTDIERTMRGFCHAIREIDPDYPIVVRRDGPNADEGFEMLRELKEDLDCEIKLFRNDTPMTKTAEVLMEMVER